MRRAIAAIVTTVAGLVLVLSFKSHAGTASTSAVATAPQTPATSSPTPSPSKKATTTTTAPAVTTHTYTGSTYDTRYGPVQVKITVVGGKLTDVSALQLPQQNRRDIEIDDYAVPQLRQEALDAQSANINSISGATYTSDGY